MRWKIIAPSGDDLTTSPCSPSIRLGWRAASFSSPPRSRCMIGKDPPQQTPIDRIAFYRRRAEQTRAQVDRATSTDGQEALRALAAAYDELVDIIERACAKAAQPDWPMVSPPFCHWTWSAVEVATRNNEDGAPLSHKARRP